MQRSGFNVVVGTFDKNGVIYHAAITAPAQPNNNGTYNDYRVLFSHPNKKTISFNISLEEDGRWVPDKRLLIDPWIADHIGNIIESKILSVENQPSTGNDN